MGLHSSVKTVLQQVEQVTGLPVHIEPDSSLPKNILARVTMARGGVPFHMVGYQPDASTAPDYLIVYQCGFILRRYAVPASSRYDFVSTEEGEPAVRSWVMKNSKQPQPAEQSAARLISFLHGGLLNQVRSIPVGLRVDAWVLKEFPELFDLQQKALSRQLNDNAAALRPDVQDVIPTEALAANISMSAAFALFWSEHLNQPQIALPYQATGYLERGRELLNLWKTNSSDASADMALVDAWAEALGMRGWYKWVKAADQ